MKGAPAARRTPPGERGSARQSPKGDGECETWLTEGCVEDTENIAEQRMGVKEYFPENRLGFHSTRLGSAETAQFSATYGGLQ
jgi:hypothetical protein